MNRLALLAVGCSFLVCSASALAGVRVGNGGGAWGCLDARSLPAPRWLEMLDLYEATNELNLVLANFPEGAKWQDVVATQRQRLAASAPGFAAAVNPLLDWVTANMRQTAGELAVIEDVVYRVRPPASACPGGQIVYVQLANYQAGAAVLVQEDDWAMLSERQRAALVIHEAIYATLRQLRGTMNSVSARRIVGYLFSTQAPAAVGDVITAALNEHHDVSFTRDVHPILERTCASCHGESGPAPHMGGSERDAYWGLNASGLYINRSWPDRSGIIVHGDDGHVGGGGSFTADDRILIQTWIEEGALAN